MSEMVEWVAKAIFAKYVSDGGGQGSLEEMTHGTQEMYRGYARAAIEALREPTKAMLLRGRSVEVNGDEANRPVGWVADDVWQVMIDAALV